tara:strand:+ start:9 stop:380 length:372 start_codon:yes stop_codon:yes gene_type:complete
MTILDDEKNAPHLNSYFDCRWAAYGTEQSAPDLLPDAYQNQTNYKNKRHRYSWFKDFDQSREEQSDDAIHPVFKIKKSSSEEDFKEVYKKMILETHPDKVEGKEQEFIKVRDAWETLDFNLNS